MNVDYANSTLVRISYVDEELYLHRDANSCSDYDKDRKYCLNCHILCCNPVQIRLKTFKSCVELWHSLLIWVILTNWLHRKTLSLLWGMRASQCIALSKSKPLMFCREVAYREWQQNLRHEFRNKKDCSPAASKRPGRSISFEVQAWSFSM